MKKSSASQVKNKVSTTSLLVLAIVILLGGLLYQHFQITDLKDEINNRVQMVYNDMDSSQQASAVVVNPQDNRVYVPELRISLPYNDVTKTLRYTYTDQDGARFYSTLVTDHAERQISCYDMVRVKHEAAQNAYSPGQPFVATVSAGALPLQLYAESNSSCEAEAWLQITPLQIAKEFKQATAY